MTQLKALYTMTDHEVQVIANNPNNFGSMLARREMNKRCISEQIDKGVDKIEIPYEFNSADTDQYRRELYSVEWI